MDIATAIPVFRIFSVEKAKEFYLGFLGFTLEWEHRFDEAAPRYAQIRRGELRMHLTEHHGDATPGSTIFVPVTDIATLHRELTDKAYGYARPGLDRVDWGWQLQVSDPFGNRLRFCEFAEPH